MTPHVVSAFRRTFWLVPILALTAALYWRALQAGFVGDDFMILYRLRPVTDAGDALRFFRAEFFEYYRPLAFVSHALDWLRAGANARQFHLTNLVLHLANVTLVFFIGRTLVRGSIAAIVAALLFALHASNHEAVVWISARFDLLATFWSLAAILMLVNGRNAIGAALFLPALLSKESAVALPIAAAAWAVFARRATTLQAIVRMMPWLFVLALYAIARSVAGGVPAAGGRLAKLVVFAIALAAVIALGDSRWVRLRDWLLARRARVAGLAIVALLAIVSAAALPDPSGALAREKLAVAGFAIFYLLSPLVDLATMPYFLDPGTNVYWLGGAAALAVAVTLVIALWRPLLQDDRMWFAAAFLAATLLPISALTEGKRYLYLPSAAFAIGVAMLIAELRFRGTSRADAELTASAKATASPPERFARRRKFRATFAFVLVLYLAVSAWQISRKTADWVWAGRMTEDGARLADAALAPRCGGNVVFLTSPVAIRGVYTHFYYETFELPRGCRPDTFNILARVVRLDTNVEAHADSSNRIVITAPDYKGNFVLSRDLRHFDVPLRAMRDTSLETPIGRVTAESSGALERLTLTLDPSIPKDVRFFYYSEGRIRSLGR